MKIKIEELKQLSQLLLDRLKNNLGEKIDFKDDLFWKIDPKQQFMLLKEPIIEICSLKDEIWTLQNLATQERNFTLDDVEKLGQLFIALGEKYEKDKFILF